MDVDYSPQTSLPRNEEKVLKFWEKSQTFSKSLEKTKGSKPYVFYEGPPTANGKPGIHHVMARSFKDLYPRFHTMLGEYCERKAGWDTHGLPVELEVEKELKLSGKKDIESYGIEKFNQKCKESVWKYVDNWVTLTKRIGFWIDMDNPYVTLSPSYIESCWWILKELWDKHLLSRDYKVLPYCPRCGTPISSHELALGYQDVTETSVFVKFKLSDKPESLLAWTTTPWTLPGNVALAVDPEAEYVKVRNKGETLILASSRTAILEGEFETLSSLKGQALIGSRYEPLFPEIKHDKPAHFVIPADFVSMEEGTGIVHTAVMYGAEDFELGKKNDLPHHHVVDLEGKFTPEVKKYSGKFVKSADKEILSDLESAGSVYKLEQYTHSYPHCWRCKTPLLYYAIESWFIRTTHNKSAILDQNSQINWIPSHMKEGRMGDWLKNMVDWSISRSRYWGTPLPIWRCTSCGTEDCIGDFATLRKRSLDPLPGDFDPHRPYIDQVKLSCPKCQSVMERYSYVLDCWFDSGAMPYAQHHYPFENKENFNHSFPADFIAEGQDQTRGWFYTLLTLSTLVSNRSSYRNVISHNLVLDEKGKKMSKSVGNIVNPIEIIDEFGADIVRWYFYSYAPMGNEYRFSRKDLTDIARRFHLMLWNSFNFYSTYASIDKPTPTLTKPSKPKHPLDSWILTRLDQATLEVVTALKEYDAFSATKSLEELLSDLSLWYVRRSRDRVGPAAADSDDKCECYHTLSYVLRTFCTLLAPLNPFISEIVFQKLTLQSGAFSDPDVSVHLQSYPSPGKVAIDTSILSQMKQARLIVERALSTRKSSALRVRQPLASLTYNGNKLPLGIEAIIAEEINVKKIIYQKSGSELTVKLDLKLTEKLREEGVARELVRNIQELRKKSNTKLDELIDIEVPDYPRKYTEFIKHKALIANITIGPELRITQ